MDTPDVYQVIVVEGLKEPFELWLAQRNLYLFPLAVAENDLPVFGVGVR